MEQIEKGCTYYGTELRGERPTREYDEFYNYHNYRYRGVKVSRNPSISRGLHGSWSVYNISYASISDAFLAIDAKKAKKALKKAKKIAKNSSIEVTPTADTVNVVMHKIIKDVLESVSSYRDPTIVEKSTIQQLVLLMVHKSASISEDDYEGLGDLLCDLEESFEAHQSQLIKLKLKLLNICHNNNIKGFGALANLFEDSPNIE